MTGTIYIDGVPAGEGEIHIDGEPSKAAEVKINVGTIGHLPSSAHGRSLALIAAISAMIQAGHQIVIVDDLPRRPMPPDLAGLEPYVLAEPPKRHNDRPYLKKKKGRS